MARDTGRGSVIGDLRASYFSSSPCPLPGGGATALLEVRNGRSYATMRPGARPRWERARGDVLSASFSAGCDLVAEEHYAFEDDRHYDGGILIRDGAGRELWRLTTRGWPEDLSLAWSAGGGRLAVATWEGTRSRTVRVLDGRTGRLLVRRRSDATLTKQAFSPDGTQLVLEESHELRILDVATGRTRSLAPERDVRYGDAPAWSPLGDRIAVTGDRAIGLLDPRTGRGPRLRVASGFGDVLAWSPDGTTLAVAQTRDTPAGGELSRLALVTAASGSRVRPVTAWTRSWLAPPAWTADSAAVLIGRARRAG